ncbi:hypothetical protein NIES4102_06960 [Chondrocystis sp. NIES-4102]|nr:hypothetical protein NIES4102_06960 [Chondrocystis sp. NIES-4102]
MLKCPACKTTYKEEVHTCKRCNLSENDIKYIAQINPNNPVLTTCIPFLINTIKRLKENNYHNQILSKIPEIEIKLEQMTTNYGQVVETIGKLENIVLNLQDKIENPSKDNSNNIDIQKKSDFYIDAESVKLHSNDLTDSTDEDSLYSQDQDNTVTLAAQTLINQVDNLQDNNSFIKNDISVLQNNEIQLPQFVQQYNMDKNIFCENVISTVLETQESVDNRLAGRGELIFFSNTNKGKYWIVKESENYYLVPHAKISINEHTKRYTLANLFECNECNSEDYSFKLIQAAKVLKVNSDLWQLEKKGKLEFY